MFTAAMNPLELTVNQLKRAASIKEQIEDLNKELRTLLGMTARSGATPKKRRLMSAAGRKNIAAAQRARWAKFQRLKSATPSVKPAAKLKRKSAATRAKLSAKLKAYWATKKAKK